MRLSCFVSWLALLPGASEAFTGVHIRARRLTSQTQVGASRPLVTTSDDLLNQLSQPLFPNEMVKPVNTDVYMNSLASFSVSLEENLGTGHAEPSHSHPEQVQATVSAVSEAVAPHAQPVADAAAVVSAVAATPEAATAAAAAVNVASSAPPPPVVTNAAVEVASAATSVATSASPPLIDASFPDTISAQTASFSNQLSGLSYETLSTTANAAKPAVVAAAQEVTQAATTAASAVTPAPTSHQVEAITKFSTQTLEEARQSGSAFFSNLFGKVDAQQIAQRSSAVLQSPKETIQAEASRLVQQTSSALDVETARLLNEGSAVVEKTGQMRVAELAETIMTALKVTGNVMFQILDVIFQTFAGTTVSEVIAGAQASVNNVIQGALQSVAATMHDISAMSVQQAAESFVALVIMVSKVVFQILGTLVQVISGKSVTEWSLEATAFLQHEASLLTAKAGAMANDFAQQTLSELAAALATFSEVTARALADSAIALLDLGTDAATTLAHSGSIPIIG